MTTKDEALRVAREALERLVEWDKSRDFIVPYKVRDPIHYALRTIALAVEGPNNCPHGIPHRWPCEQCDSPAVQSVALGGPNQWVTLSESLRFNINKIILPPGYMIDGDTLHRDGTLQFIPHGLPGTSNDQQAVRDAK